MKRLANLLNFADTPLLIVVILLLIVGLAAQYAISLGENNLQIFYRQGIYSVLGLVIFLLMANYNYHVLAKKNRLIYVLLILLLGYLLVFGDPIRGSARWIDLGFFQLQPAELAKVIVAIGFARWLYLKRGQINAPSSVLLTLIYALLPAVLILLEPDLGSAMIVGVVWFGMVLLSPMRKYIILLFIIIGLVLAGLSWQYFLQDYQKQRIEVFLDPNKDQQGKGYNVRQAIIAVGSGQLTGRGLGQGIQSQLKFLPEKHTDFVFAALSEEVGLLGSTTIVVLFYILLFRLLLIMRKARDDLGKYLAGGILFLFASQVVINIGMNIGLLPVTGIPLPLITFGGSSLLVSMGALGIAQNIAKQAKTVLV